MPRPEFGDLQGAPLVGRHTRFAVVALLSPERGGHDRDRSQGRNAGTVIDSAFCFSEFFVVALAEGDLYANSGPNGTCGATMDPVMKPPKFTDHGAQVVIAGGGDGVITGGTGKYQAWTGTFTDRVFVGFGAPSSGVGGIVYYDQLLFSFTGK